MSEFIPNSFQTPNAIVDKLMELLTDGELRVLMYTIRHVLGWQKKIKKRKATISISNFVNGFSYTDDKGQLHTYAGCGLKEAAVRDALQSLEKFRILSSSDPSAQGREWELAFMTTDDVDFGALQTRFYEKNNKSKAKMNRARELNPKLTPSVQQSPSYTTEPTPFCATEPDPSNTTGDNETHGETQKETHIAPSASDTKKLTAAEHEELIAAIESVLKIAGTRQMQYYHLLLGTSKNKAWASSVAYFATNPMKGKELAAFGVWYVKNCPNASVPTSPEKLEDWVRRYRAKQSKPTASLAAAADTIFSANNLTTDGVVIFEKGKK